MISSFDDLKIPTEGDTHTCISDILAGTELPCIHAYYVFGSGGSDIRLKTDTRFLASGPAAWSYTLKTIHANCFFYGYTMFFF